MNQSNASTSNLPRARTAYMEDIIRGFFTTEASDDLFDAGKEGMVEASRTTKN